MEINPYVAPRSVVADTADSQIARAARTRRLAAAVIDTVCLILAWGTAELLLLLAGVELAGEQGDGDWSWLWTFEPASNAIGFAVYLAMQGPLLATRAQTIGKMLLQIRIADMQGARPPFGRIVLRRELPGWIANVTLATGVAYFLFDVLLIFRRNRRCLHDLIAGTQVVVVR